MLVDEAKLRVLEEEKKKLEEKEKKLEEEKAVLTAQLDAAIKADNQSDKDHIRQQLMHNQDALKANETNQTKVLELIITTASEAAATVQSSHSKFSSRIRCYKDLKVNESDFVVDVAKDFKLSDCLKSGVTVSVPDDGSGEDPMQAMLHDVAVKVKDDLPLVLKAAAKSNQVPVAFEHEGEAFKPDGVIYSKDLVNMTSGIVAFIELKKKGETLGNNEKFQLLKYVNAILQIQPHRSFCYGMLTNGVDAMLYKGVRQQNSIGCECRLICSTSYRDGALLAWLMTSSPTDVLGWGKLEVILPDSNTYHLTTFIGSGQHCDAYELEVDGETRQKVVMKRYIDAEKAEQEREVCKLLIGVPNVACLAPERFQPKDKLFVAIQQRGHPFDSEHQMNEEHANCLVQAVEALHAKGIAHRDIFGGNIYYLDANKAMLNDWSHVKREEECKNKEHFKELCVEDFEKLSDAVHNFGARCANRVAFTYVANTATNKRTRDEPPAPEKSPKKNADGAAAKGEE